MGETSDVANLISVAHSRARNQGAYAPKMRQRPRAVFQIGNLRFQTYRFCQRQKPRTTCCPNRSMDSHAHCFPGLSQADRARAPAVTDKELRCPLVVRSTPYILVEVSPCQSLRLRDRNPSVKLAPGNVSEGDMNSAARLQQLSSVGTLVFVEGECRGSSGCETIRGNALPQKSCVSRACAKANALLF